MKAADVMTRRVIGIGPDATIVEAARLMLTERVSGLPVIGLDGALIGMVTEADLLHRAEIGTEIRRPRWLEFFANRTTLAQDYVRSHGRLVREVMTAPAITITEDTPLEEVVRLMEERGIKRLPVVRGEETVGLISRANLVKALADLADVTPLPLSDEGIRQRLLLEMRDLPWTSRSTIDVMVRDGVVHLWGAIFEDGERTALKVLAENVPGVKAVHDHLAWIEPSTGVLIDPPSAKE